MFSRTKEVIGFHLGSEHAAAVVLQLTGDQKTVVVREYAVAEMPDGAGSIESALRDLRRKLRTRRRECAISAWPEGARLKFFSHRSSNRLRVQELMQADVRSFFHEDLSNYILSCDTLAEAREEETEETPFLGCGMPRQDLLAFENAFSALRYEIQLIQLSPVAMYNAFTSSQEEPAWKESHLLVDFGKRRSLVIGGTEGRMRFVRTIETGWAAVAEEMKSMYGIDLHTAEEGDEIAEEAVKVAIQPLARGVIQSSHHLQMECNAPEPARIQVSGALCGNLFVTRALSAAVELPCVQWNPFRRMAAKHRTLENFELLADLSMLPAAAGAALQCLL